MDAHAFVKLLHISCAALSIAGFLPRAILALRDSPIATSHWMRVLPHANDTLLLAAAIWLAINSGQYPFADRWLTAKLFGLILYIALGALAMRRGKAKALRIAALMAALATYGYIVSVAITRKPFGFLAGAL